MKKLILIFIIGILLVESVFAVILSSSNKELEFSKDVSNKLKEKGFDDIDYIREGCDDRKCYIRLKKFIIEDNSKWIYSEFGGKYYEKNITKTQIMDMVIDVPKSFAVCSTTVIDENLGLIDGYSTSCNWYDYPDANITAMENEIIKELLNDIGGAEIERDAKSLSEAQEGGTITVK